jgi:predicted Zn-dependent protease
MVRLAMILAASMTICLVVLLAVRLGWLESNPPNVAPAETSGTSQPPAPAKPVGQPAPPARTAPAVAKPLRAKPPAEKPKTSSRSLLPAIPNSLEDVFSTGQKLSQRLDNVVQQQLSLSAAEESELGQALQQRLAREKRLWQEPALLARLTRLSEPLLRERDRPQITYQIYLLDEEAINAFSHLGGYVYLTRGLLDLQPSDAELEAVLGHEIAHVDLKHCVQKLTYAARAARLGGGDAASLVQLGYQLVSLGYSEEQEFQADAWSYKTMLKIGRTKPQATEFLRRLAKLESADEKPRGAPNASLLDRFNTQVQNHFRTHPPTEIRLRQLEQLP